MIHLRPITVADVPAIVAACADPEIPRWTTVPEGYTEADALAFLSRREHRKAIVDDADDRLLGIISVPEHEGDEVEFGYWLAAEARGRGVMTAALALAGDWVRDELGARRAKLLVHRDNERSLATARRAGYADSGALVPCVRGRPATADDPVEHVVLRRAL